MAISFSYAERNPSLKFYSEDVQKPIRVEFGKYLRTGQQLRAAGSPAPTVTLIKPDATTTDLSTSIDVTGTILTFTISDLTQVGVYNVILNYIIETTGNVLIEQDDVLFVIKRET